MILKEKLMTKKTIHSGKERSIDRVRGNKSEKGKG